MIILTLEQRLLIERIASNQRATLVEGRAWSKLLDKIGFDDAERAAAFEVYSQRAAKATPAGFEPSPLDPREIELSDGDRERLERSLKAFNGYSCCDYRTFASIMESLGKPEASPKEYPAWFRLETGLQARLMLLIFLKQQTGTPAEARKLLLLAQKFSLSDEECETIRYRTTPNGGCQWGRDLIAAPREPKGILLTDSELAELTEKIRSHEGWLPADCRWLDPLLDKLETREAGKTVVD